MAGVAVGKYDQVDRSVAHDLLELRFGPDRDAGRVERAGELGRISPLGDSGDLGRREGDHLERGIVAVDDVEVVEVAPGSAHDQDAGAGSIGRWHLILQVGFGCGFDLDARLLARWLAGDTQAAADGLARRLIADLVA